MGKNDSPISLSKASTSCLGRDMKCPNCTKGRILKSKGKVKCYCCGYTHTSVRQSPENSRDREYKNILRKSKGLPPLPSEKE